MLQAPTTKSASPFFISSLAPTLAQHGDLGVMAEIGEVGSLGKLLEQDGEIRDLARSNRQLTQWPSEDCIGVPSCTAIGYNLRLILEVVDWWGKQQSEPKPIPVDIIKREAG